jgi:DNA ligase-1
MLCPNTDPLRDPDYFKNLRFPLLCSVKLDGIRCIVKDNACKSRSYIDLPSKYVQNLFSGFAELDGEIIVGNESDFDVYNRTQSFVMSEDKPTPDFQFRVFDCADLSLADKPFYERFEAARFLVDDYKKEYPFSNVTIVEHQLCRDLDELLFYEEVVLKQGYEGLIMRAPFGRYKHGRGTFKEGLIYKLKRFQDDEAVVVGFGEQLENMNLDVRSNLGMAKRSTMKSGMVSAGTMGKILADYKGQLLEIAPGCMKHDERLHVWQNHEDYYGKILKFRHFTHGVKEMPRFPRFVGWRDPIDFRSM